MNTTSKKHVSVKNCWKSFRKLKPEKNLELINVASRCTQTSSYSVVDIIGKLRKQQNEVKCMKNANGLLEGEVRHLLAETSAHKKSIDHLIKTIRQIKETKEEIVSNNELLNQLLNRRKAEGDYCQAEIEEVIKETDKIKEWRNDFKDEQINEVAYLQETLFQARKLRLMVVNTSDTHQVDYLYCQIIRKDLMLFCRFLSMTKNMQDRKIEAQASCIGPENNLSNLEDLFKSSGSGLPIEIDEGTELIRKKQCLEKRYYEAKEYVERLQLENEMLLKNLDKLTLVYSFDLLSSGDDGMQNNNHCACRNPFQSENYHSRSLVPKLDLTFLDSDTDISSTSDSSGSSDSDSEDYSDSDESERCPIPSKKNFFEQIVSIFMQ